MDATTVGGKSKADPAVFPISIELHRQRKSLIIINVILFFMKFGEVTITKITSSGLQMEIENINAIYTLLWMMWVYFLIRFYNQYRLEGLYLLREAWRNSGDHTPIKELINAIRSKPGLENYDFDHPYSLIERDGKKYKLRITERDPETDFVEISSSMAWKYRFKAIKYLLKNHTQILDQWFPLALSFITLIYCNITRWDGSILKLIGIW